VDSNPEEAPKVKKTTANGRTRPPRKRVKEESDGSDDDEPLKTPQKPKAVVSRKRKAKVRDSEAEDDTDEPPKKSAASKPRQKKVKEEGASTMETPKPKKGTKAKKPIVKEEEAKSPMKGKGKKKEEEEEEIFKWWENEQGDGTIKWNTLEHYGVFFPPPYEPLPKDIKMLYKGMFGIPVLSYLLLKT